MIAPGDLHRYFIVREVASGRERWLLGGDVRYDGNPQALGEYWMAADGRYVLVRSVMPTHPWGALLRIDEIEPLPDGKGAYHPDHLAGMALQLMMSYEGSWRQYADAHAPVAS